MAKKDRPSVRKREREVEKRKREIKKAQKAADKRDRKFNRDQGVSSVLPDVTDPAVDREGADQHDSTSSEQPGNA